EDHAALLDNRVAGLPEARAQPAALRLGRGFEALAVDGEQPAVEGAAQSAILQTTEGQIGTAVRAVAVEQTEFALLVSEKNEILPHEPYGLERTSRLQFLGERNRLPVA